MPSPPTGGPGGGGRGDLGRRSDFGPRPGGPGGVQEESQGGLSSRGVSQQGQGAPAPAQAPASALPKVEPELVWQGLLNYGDDDDDDEAAQGQGGPQQQGGGDSAASRPGGELLPVVPSTREREQEAPEG